MERDHIVFRGCTLSLKVRLRRDSFTDSCQTFGCVEHFFITNDISLRRVIHRITTEQYTESLGLSNTSNYPVRVIHRITRCE